MLWGVGVWFLNGAPTTLHRPPPPRLGDETLQTARIDAYDGKTGMEEVNEE